MNTEQNMEPGKADEREFAQNSAHLTIDARKILIAIFVFCLAWEIFLVVSDTFINFRKGIPIPTIQRFFNIGREDSLSNWYSSTQTLVVGAVLWCVVVAHWKVDGLKYLKNKRVWGWSLIAAFFTYLGIDDATALHERLGTAFKEYTQQIHGTVDTSVLKKVDAGYGSYEWQLVLGPIFVLMGFFILAFLWRQLATPRGRLLIFIALAVYGSAESLDYLEGLVPEDKGLRGPYDNIAVHLHCTPETVGHYQKVIEEFLEAFGSTIFLVTFLNRLFEIAPRWQIQVNREKP
jgi:hypothetical protein